MSDDFEELNLGEVALNWGGHEILSVEPHCRITRRARDGALFAEIWLPTNGCEERYQYIGPVRLPAWPT